MTQNPTADRYERVGGEDARIETLIALLAGQGWMTAQRVIGRHHSETGIKWHDRMVRDLAAESRGEVAGGQRGYKLVREMSREEMEHARNWMKSQAARMTERATEIETVWHSSRPKPETERLNLEKRELL
jgi:hypothetical protein